MKRFKYIPDKNSLSYDLSKCKGCGKCVEVCPHAVFRMNGKKAELIGKDYCIECGACMMNCSHGAITVETGPGCARAVINSLVRSRKKSACCG